MPRRSPRQDHLPALNVPRRKGRVRASVAREISAARARGLEVSAASVTVCYVLADLLDGIDETGDDKYLAPQLAARLLEERRAANLLPDKPTDAIDDVWAGLAAELADLEQ